MRQIHNEWVELLDGVRLSACCSSPPVSTARRRVEAVQRGTSAGTIDRGWALGGTEPLIGHFQDYARERLGLHNDPA
ncbi:MAG: hypothetical protein NVS3B18_14880 [Candidatus Dormibacteria bacterium]